MQNIIIADASCIILLDIIGELNLLHSLFGNITTTQEVAAEYGMPLPSWFHVHQPSDTILQGTLEATLDKGEASAIALALEHKDCLLIIDELKGRKLAR